MKNTNKKLVYTALFAMIIFLGTSVLKFEIAPRMMVHLGNALVVLSFFALKYKNAILASAVGLGIFDITHNYISSIHFTILESIIVIIVLLLSHKLLKEKMNISTVFLLSSIAGLTKVFVIFIRRFIQYYFTLSSDLALPTTLSRMPNSIITAVFTAIITPIIYSQIKKWIEKIRKEF